MDEEVVRIEVEVRKRVAQVLSSAGVDSDRVALEVLFLLPPEFVLAYQELYAKALELPGAVKAGDPNSQMVQRTSDDQLPLAKRGKKYHSHWLVKDERALRRKQQIDHQLRQLAGKATKGFGEPRARCNGPSRSASSSSNSRGSASSPNDGGIEGPGGCGRWVKKDWSWCAWCGVRLGT